MDLQNALFAPGWAWSLLSLVLVVGSLFGLYRQLRLQSAQGAREQLESLDREWNTERFDRCKLEVLSALRDGRNAEAVPRAPAFAIANYWERVGALAFAGHVDRLLLHGFNGGACPVWWVALGPLVRELRIAHDDPTEYRRFEWLADQMDTLDRRAGANAFDAATLSSQLDERIAVYEDRIRFERALRAFDEVPAPTSG